MKIAKKIRDITFKSSIPCMCDDTVMLFTLSHSNIMNSEYEKFIAEKVDLDTLRALDHFVAFIKNA